MLKFRNELKTTKVKREGKPCDATEALMVKMNQYIEDERTHYDWAIWWQYQCAITIW